MDLICKPRSKSIVWLYFGLKADEKGQPLNSGEAVCRLCRKIVLAKGGNTTNLRSHLRRRHRADFLETSSSTIPASLLESQSLDLNHEEFYEDVSFFQNASSQNNVPDAVLPPGDPWLHGGPPRAVLSLPSCLWLCGDIGSGMSGSSGGEPIGEMKVYAKCHLQQGVMFGPFVGELCRGQMPTNLKYSWAIREDAAFIYVDATDENKSNWMRYVTYTSREEEHNLVVFQCYRRIYYRVSQPVSKGTELRVWIGKDYATLVGLGMGDNVKCEVGDKDTALHLLQDIQLVTLPEPSNTSLWSDHSQSQSPMPVISDVSTMSHVDAAYDSGVVSGSGSAFTSTSLISFPSPSLYQMEKYDFIAGTDKLLSNPNATQSSPWYFFGFEPDPTGRPLDRSTAVCKLCGEHVSCAGGAADLQNHLTNKHHIRPRDSNKDRCVGQIRSHPLVVNSGLISTFPEVVCAQVTDAITRFLIMDLQPPALVGGKGFKQLIHSLQPCCKELPSPCKYKRLSASQLQLETEQIATFDWLKKEAIRIVKEDRRRSQSKKHREIKRSPSPGSPESDSDFVRRSKRLKESHPINFREAEDEDDESDVGEADDESPDPGLQGGLSGMEFLLGDLFCSAPRSRQSSVEESVDMEMSVFRADKGASLGVEPLQWWRTKAVQFPLLATVARAYLAAPAVAGNVAHYYLQEGIAAMYWKRGNIPPESLDAILFLHHNNMATTKSLHTAVRTDDRNSGVDKVS